MSINEVFGEPISFYSRQQAIEDCELVDVTSVAAEAGFSIPVALTRAVYVDCVEWYDADTKRQTYQDEQGRLWDVLWMSILTAKRSQDESIISFNVLRVPRGGKGRKPKPVNLKMIIHGGDEGEPVITIMMPDED
jgi:hypothetical protein